MPQRGTYQFYDRDMAHTGKVTIDANGKWKWAGFNRTRNSGTWQDFPGGVTTFTTRQGIVAKRHAKSHCNYDSTKPWFNTNLVDLGSPDK